MEGKIGRELGRRFGDLQQRSLRHGGLGRCVGRHGEHSLPEVVERRGPLARPVFTGLLDGRFQPLAGYFAHLLVRGLRHLSFADQLLRVKFSHRWMRGDLAVHHRLRVAGFVHFVVAVAAVTPQVDHHVALEPFAEFDRQAGGMHDRLGDRRHSRGKSAPESSSPRRSG